MTLKVPCSFHSLVTPASHFVFFNGENFGRCSQNSGATFGD